MKRFLTTLAAYAQAYATPLALALLALLLVLAALTAARLFGMWPVEWLRWELKMRQALR